MISLSTARKLVQEAVKNPKVTSRELQEQLVVSGVHVHTSSICRHLNEDGLFARMPGKKPLLTAKAHKSTCTVCPTACRQAWWILWKFTWDWCVQNWALWSHEWSVHLSHSKNCFPREKPGVDSETWRMQNSTVGLLCIVRYWQTVFKHQDITNSQV